MPDSLSFVAVSSSPTAAVIPGDYFQRLLFAAGGCCLCRSHPLIQLLGRKHPKAAVRRTEHLVLRVARHAADVDQFAVALRVGYAPVKVRIGPASQRVDPLRLDLAAAQPNLDWSVTHPEGNGEL